ncbi:D-alanyl-D-alanine carboxypeptidase [Eubacteriales bacterium OttesenSCG-928-N14]|nr:D-alanyl-D-alanine carboxypeptidase [Eubacteriales bacterium OttesenSCG-928-N14]
MKKSIVLFALAILLLLPLPVTAAAADISAKDVDCSYLVLMEASTGAVLLEKNADKRAYPASTTKIMTCILALEMGDLDAKVTVGPEVWRGFGSKSSLMHLKEGETVTLRDLVYGMMLISGNDAAAAIAVHLSGSIDAFADVMNAKAQELGMDNTHFVNPHGLHSEEHYTTARDMAKLMAYAVNNSDFCVIGKTQRFTVPKTNKAASREMVNTNKLVATTDANRDRGKVYEYRYANAGKTGETTVSGHCLVSGAKKDDIQLVCVQLSAKESDNRFKQAPQLYNWGFTAFSKMDAVDIGLPQSSTIQADGGEQIAVDIDYAGRQLGGTKEQLEALKANSASIEQRVLPVADSLHLPVTKGDKLAKIEFVYDGQVILTADAVAAQSLSIEGDAEPIEQVANDDGGGISFWVILLILLLLGAGAFGGYVLLRYKSGYRIRRKRRL